MVRIGWILTVLMAWQITWASPFAPIPSHPNIDVTPGDHCESNDKDFKEFRYPENMPYCERNVSQGLKTKIYKLYNIPLKCKHRYTVDHLVPLSLGGNNSTQNLWPEHVLVKETRLQLEQELYESVVGGKMTSEKAVEILLEEKFQLQLDLSNVDGCG